MSLSTIRLAIGVLGGLFALAGLIITIMAIKTILFDHRPLIGLLQFSAGGGVLLALFMGVRLQAETLLAAHRTHDRLTVLSDAMRVRRDISDAPTPSAQAKTKND